MSELTSNIVLECKKKLLEAKKDLLLHAKQRRSDYLNRDTKGDDGDQTVNSLAEDQFITTHHRIRKNLLEIERALAKMERGIYGICEATEEHIESERLLAIPWTRFSIEGAELIETQNRRFAGPSA